MPGQIRTLINDMCEDEEVKVGMQAVVHQPRHSIKKLAMAKLAGRTPTGGGHGETADRISNSFASRPCFHQQQAHPRRETVGRFRERKRAGKNRKKG